MGDRALIIFHDDEKVSPTVYLHWSGSHVPELLGELKDRMKGREGDLAYAAARFVGICHEHIDGNLSLGVSSNKFGVNDLLDRELMKATSHGDAGVVIVNVEDFTWKAHGGYLASHSGGTIAA